MQLIDADHLISILKEYVKREDSYISICNNPILAKGIKRGLQEAVQTVNKEPTVNQWIPCSERLPDEDYWTGANFQYSADVLMTVYNAEDEETIIDYGHTVDGSWYSDTTDCLVPSGWEVLAWMPLPEPYKGEE